MELIHTPVVQELAWCTYSLVCNVNCSCVLVLDERGQAVGARGSFGQSPLLTRQPQADLKLFTKVALQPCIPGLPWKIGTSVVYYQCQTLRAHSEESYIHNDWMPDWNIIAKQLPGRTLESKYILEMYAFSDRNTLVSGYICQFWAVMWYPSDPSESPV